MEVQVESFTNPVTREEQDTKEYSYRRDSYGNLQNGQQSQIKIMGISTPALNFDDSGKNAFYSVIEFK